MAERITLTDARVSRLRPRTVEYTVWDTRMAGLGVRVRPSGGKSYVWRRRGDPRSRRVTLGPTAERSVEEARRACAALWNGADTGSSSAAGSGARAPLFRDFVAGPWRTACYLPLKPTTRCVKDNILKNRLLPAFGATPLDAITRLDIVRWFERGSRHTPGGANGALQTLRQIMNHAVVRGHIDADPTRGVKANPRPMRTRFLSRDEIERLHAVLDHSASRSPSWRDQADAIRLLLLTGCRKNEVLTLRWQDVDGDVLNLADSKTGPRRVLLNAAARTLLEKRPRAGSPWVFPSPLNPAQRRVHLGLWLRARRLAGIEDMRLHDLRHTFASQAVLEGVPLPVVARLLGHNGPQMTLRYAHVADRDIEAAAERIGGVMARLMDIQTAAGALTQR